MEIMNLEIQQGAIVKQLLKVVYLGFSTVTKSTSLLYKAKSWLLASDLEFLSLKHFNYRITRKLFR